MASISTQLGSYWRLTLTVNEASTNVQGNYSTVNYSVTMTSTGGIAQYNGAGTVNVYINGSHAFSKNVSLNVGAYGSVNLGSGSWKVGHDSDGAKYVGFSVSYSSATGAYYMPTSGSTSGGMQLSKIPRASKINSFTGKTVDGDFVVTYTKQVSSYTDRLRISIPNVKALMTKDAYVSGTAIKLDADSLEYIYKNYTTTQTVQLGAVMETYSGATKIGESEELKIDVSINCPPVIKSVALKETGLSDIGVADTDVVSLIGKKSVTVNCYAVNYALVRSITVQNGNNLKSETGNNVLSTTFGFEGMTSPDFVVTVTDSRGFTVTKTVTGKFYPYFKPTIQSLDVARPNDTADTATITGSGTFWKGTIGTKENTVTYTITDDASVPSKEPIINDNDWTINEPLTDVPYQHSFRYTITIKDAFGYSETRRIDLTASVPVLSFGKHTVRINGTELTQYIRDVVYPVGAIYISTSQVDPSTLFGGKWEPYAQGRTIIGVGTGNDGSTSMSFTPGSEIGEYQHVLTWDEMPRHMHDVIFSESATAVQATNGFGRPPFSNNMNRLSNGSATVSAGSSNAHSLIQPSVVTYIWRRVS